MTNNNGSARGMVEAQMRATVAEGWKSLPEQARSFLLETPVESLTIHSFAKFWSSPRMIEYALNHRLARIVSDASMSIALNSLYLGKEKESRALMRNGAFFLDCMESGVESIAQWSRENGDLPCMPELKHFSHAFSSVRTPEVMEAYLEKKIRKRHSASHSKEVADFVKYSTKSNQRPAPEMSEGEQIQLILADDASAEEQILIIRSSTTLKTLFNEYAEKRGVSLRSLRFSYDGKTLFLSAVSNRTPDELNMKDQDIITVCDTTRFCQETRICGSKKKKAPTQKKASKKHNNSRRKAKGKGKLEQCKQRKNIKTLADYKAHHSTMLSKLHEEVQPRLKEIRIRLNALGIECQPRKNKRNNKRNKKNKDDRKVEMSLPNSGVGGKAGKPHFIVQVGEVQNLYKSTKSQRNNLYNALTLDLHGYTVDEALTKLDESLAAWVDTAMQGSYPFVIPAKIVCGCGNQIISETVEKWIRKHAQVANSPKGTF
mmetsp:Transcript_10798/g.19544  ORF Transcript_10798/g.19544 Transcript_10798/m.19544 type:complete len:487 (-) Transcript_10798:31-1491(-)|eukprot:CAMPEP_0196137788 /NCGR_PEP_ID=MMETSP0910-20130528/5659_1 /TAXON_ID=49265 /ORGANISM="Thalassiosira rotula, Strain GSO102" /LENGTH=486 /DNA_ID=CAMNT_0041398297 /DNA_START=127 /DNA_END=1590 /DNA_ORIENTATION=+